jgi:charged multivesicular body protein 3
MQSINRFLYGPTAEEKVRAWRTKLRSKQRELEREMRQVGHPEGFTRLALMM